MSLFDQYSPLLLAFLQQLAEFHQLPVCVDELCRKIKVPIDRSERLGRNALLTKGPQGTRILLPKPASSAPRDYTPVERVLIAHELGHALMLRLCGISPLGESEYWKHEEICDLVARRMLLPDAIVQPWIESSAPAASERLNLVFRIANRGHVPWYVAAHRISEVDVGTAFIALKPIKKQGEVRLQVHVTTVAGRKEINRRIARESALTSILEDLGADDSPLDPILLSCFPSLGAIHSAVARQLSRYEYILAMRLDRGQGTECENSKADGSSLKHQLAV